ncbi:hypothetical protein CSC70_12235 [Pseudoxanthomonas kalamensis DSM 18571]|uniref:RcnB family protein n=1 Tax=Pseudoxanthomonas kalamensis TaxID=289483 RepID=UPI001391A20C|nr:RcnB family protein [Pseudoxanthomonas kalamensis]KAF1708863.1 hypothetical protein CSC70_12235 [Pseudoxanthomonas kalamensis DSM 18571]
MKTNRIALIALSAVLAAATAVPAMARDHDRGRGNDRQSHSQSDKGRHDDRYSRSNDRSRNNDRNRRNDRRHDDRSRYYADHRDYRAPTRTVVYKQRPVRTVVYRPPTRTVVYRPAPPAYGWRRGVRYYDYGYAPTYVVNDYYRYGLHHPPHGYYWRRSDAGDYLLVAIATGIIADLILNR